MHSLVAPDAWVVLRLPSDTLKVLQVIPNTIISLGKYGTFPSNLILSRPYNLTYELLDRTPGVKDSELRIVPASELHAETIAEENGSSADPASQDIVIGGDGVEYQLVGENGQVIMRTNRETIDDSARQTLTMEEIETLKREGTGAGKDLIAKLMLSHTGLDQKTAFSLSKYKLLKTKKYLRRFTVLPVDVPMLTHWIINEKDSSKILEFREEMLALIGSWSNVHYSQEPTSTPGVGGGRWLAIDDTGGLLVAAMAERMGILYPDTSETNPGDNESHIPLDPPLASSNTITLIHINAQPNLSLLSYFDYQPNSPTSVTSAKHPLASHLLPLSWLQLLDPSLDTAYANPPPIQTPEELAAMKATKRGTYYRKQRRYNRTKHIVDATQKGGFDGLAIASSMDPVSILKRTIPLLKGGAPVAIYSPTIEPLVILADCYSTSRRTAFIQSPPPELESLSPEELVKWQGNDDFPLNPTLLLAVSVQSSRVRQWQVLPGRTHPLMTSRGGAEGYLFTATRVIPAEGKVEARGKFAKKKSAAPVRKSNVSAGIVDSQDSAPVVVETEPVVQEEDLEMANS